MKPHSDHSLYTAINTIQLYTYKYDLMDNQFVI